MIVITGATGNVGRPLTASLVSAGHVVTAVTRGSSASLPGGPGVIAVPADLTDPAAARSLAGSIAGAEALFLLVPGSGARAGGGPAGRAAVLAGGRQPSRRRRVHADGVHRGRRHRLQAGVDHSAGRRPGDQRLRPGAVGARPAGSVRAVR